MSSRCTFASKRTVRLLGYVASVLLASTAPFAAQAATVANPNPGCGGNTALFDPGNGQDIVVAPGFNVSVFASGLNFPTGLAFRKTGGTFEVYVLESGHGLPSRCNDESTVTGGTFAPNNPFTPDILVFNQNGTKLRTLGKPTAMGVGFQTSGPAVDIGFENGFQGGRLFATDSNQATHAGGAGNNSSRIVTVDAQTGQVTPFITGLPTGDHPSEQLEFKNNWIYWSQGSTTNSGVVGRDNGGGTGQHDIPCQDIVLSQNVFDSGGGVFTSGYSTFGTTRPGATVPAFDSALHHGVCDGAILRARLNTSNPTATIEPFSWGYRNGYAIRFAPENHVLKGGLLVGEDGADERGARPSNNAPDNLQLAQQNADGTPDYHGWPDRYGFLPSSQAVFNPIGGPGDDLCVPDPSNLPSTCTPASLLKIVGNPLATPPIPGEDVPIRNVLDHPPQPITAPLATEAADSSFTGIDFVPNSFARGEVQRGAALYALEGDFGFSAPNATDPAPEVGHEIKVVNFSNVGEPLALQIMRFAFNKSGDQAFVSPGSTAEFNRPTNVKFGPDGCAWVADYGAVRDFGQSGTSVPSPTKFVGAANGPLVQIPGTGVIWRICPQ
jgi:glucose/arabinose dehydrogenase